MDKKTTGKRYIEAVGRRKTSTARVRLTPATKETVIVNGKNLAAYFKTKELVNIVGEPMSKAKIDAKFEIEARVLGGGSHSQSEAIRHGIARALTEFDLELRTKLKKAGFLKRDPRMKERRKFGLKKARKAPQWSKR